MDFEQVFFHQGVHHRMVGKAAVEPVNAIDDKGCALLLLADKLDHALEFGPIALGRAFDDAEDFDHVQLTPAGVFLQIGELSLQ
ncbi:MAG TPA: hypothetical protein VMV79_04860 [Alphaproteobacteria bacterium]|nr:hypothetical protein [Alphaproteobacteria bacterium]